MCKTVYQSHDWGTVKEIKDSILGLGSRWHNPEENCF